MRQPPQPLAEPSGPLERLAQLEAGLAALRAEQERDERLTILGTQAAMLAHELNNVLNTITMAASVSNAEVALARITEAAQRGGRLSALILRFASGPRSGLHQRCDATSVVKAVAAELPRPARIRVELQSPMEEVWVGMDPQALWHVLVNLGLNSITAMRASGGSLTIRLTPSATWNIPVRITVADTGSGMSADRANRAFEPWATWSEGGTGLGLALCKRLVEDAGGTIVLASQAGHGTTVAIELSPEHLPISHNEQRD